MSLIGNKNLAELPANDVIVYTQDDLAQKLNTNVQTISYLRQSGCIKFIKIGKRFLTTGKWLSEFFDSYAGDDLSNYYLMSDAVGHSSKCTAK
ncbi:MAG: helix-turn-helix domain-containing protein [Bacillus sp. (in: Bacteria)]|nr:helix-turn-helix domain-containing protein [Bacillus sp. (in: firmicutes)]